MLPITYQTVSSIPVLTADGTRLTATQEFPPMGGATTTEPSGTSTIGKTVMPTTNADGTPIATPMSANKKIAIIAGVSVLALTILLIIIYKTTK